MTSRNDNTAYAALKARAEACGHKLVTDCMSKLYILDPKTDELLAVQLDQTTIERELQYLEKDSDTATADDDDTPLERARDRAQMATYEIRDLISAALAINDNEDGRIEACLNAAQAKVVKLSEDLDSVNWPESKGGAA